MSAVKAQQTVPSNTILTKHFTLILKLRLIKKLTKIDSNLSPPQSIKMNHWQRNCFQLRMSSINVFQHESISNLSKES